MLGDSEHWADKKTHVQYLLKVKMREWTAGTSKTIKQQNSQ